MRSAIPFDESLLLFSDQTQFILDGQTNLTPSNVTVTVTTEYENNAGSVKPVGTGSNVFFSYDRGSYSGFREYYVESDGETNRGEDITANIPKYIPSNLFKVALANNDNTLVALSSTSSENIDYMFINGFMQMVKDYKVLGINGNLELTQILQY